MAYYAALVSTVQFLEEMSHSEHQYPNSLFEKQQITSLYQTLSDLQKSLEDFSPNDQEASGLLDRIRDAACLAQDLVEYQIPEAASQARDIFESHVPAQAERSYISNIPAAVYQAEIIIESEISDQIREPNCLEEIIHVAFSLFVSACHNSEPVKVTLRKGYKDFLKLTKQLRSIVRKGYVDLEKLINEVGSVNVGRIHVDLVRLKKKLDSHKVKGYLDLVKLKEELDPIDVKQGYPYLVELKEEHDAIDVKGYPDLVKLKKELEPIVVNGYQELLKLKEELDSIEEKGFQDSERVKEEVNSIVGLGYQVLERVKEEVDSIVGKGCKYLLENVNGVVDYIGRRGYQDLEKLIDEIDSINMGKGCLDLEKLNEELDPIVVKGYQDLVILKKKLDAIARRGNQNMKTVKEEVDSIAGRGYWDLERVKEEVDSIVGSGYRNLERLKEEVDSIVGKRYKDLLEMVKEEVDSILGDLTRIKERNTSQKYDDLQVSAGVSTQGPSDGKTLVGFERRLTTIKEQLVGDPYKLEVISIVGMGGIGKTTLAGHIFYDKLIDHVFDIRVWVTVSQSYHLENILLSIVDSLNINEEKLHRAGKDKLMDHIIKHLSGKKYLIIMDDVWDTKFWDDVKRMFGYGDCSRIILTTRHLDVASLATKSQFINQITILDYDQSWDLFREKVFCPPELENVGRSIVKRCQGLPLAIVAVAGVLSKTPKTLDHWGDIARQLSSTLAENDARFSEILSLSYDHLPHHLKPCFLYLVVFPEEYEISVSKLIKLWVAEGLLKPIASKSLEEAAEEYLEELVKRNLVFITKWRSNGKFRCCSIHVLLRDLCAERARHEHFLIFLHKYSATTTRHKHRFIIYPDSPSNISMPEKDFLQVRSFLSFGKKPVHVSSHPSNFKPLRVLDAPYTDFTFSPFELLHLRYLVLLSSEFHIPSSIFKLQHLQTFIVISSRRQIISLPSEIWKMPRLEHVMGDRLKLPPFVDVGGNIHGRVPSWGVLQTLSTLVDFKFNHDTVQMMPSLKKLKLQFSRFKPVENVWEKFGIKYLFHLSLLETLDINIVKKQLNLTPFPESFSFPLTLKKLNLRGCRLPWEDMTLVGSLPNLQVLNLRWESFVGGKWETKEGEFLMLKFLLMDSLTGLKYWQTESTHFPCLEHLVIEYCHGLEGIPSDIGDIPCLRLIEVRSCNSSLKSSALMIQEEQFDLGNDDLQVRIR